MNQINEYHETVSSGHSPYQETEYQERFTESIKEEDTKDNKERIPIKTKTDEKGYKDDIVGIQTWRPWIKKEGETTQSTEDKTKVIPKVIPYEMVASAIRTASFVSHCCGKSTPSN